MDRLQSKPFDVADYLDSPELMAAYLEAAIDESGGDPAVIAKALGDIARAQGMSRIAGSTGMSRESLYKALSGRRNPEFGTVLRVLTALGLSLRVEPASTAAR